MNFMITSHKGGVGKTVAAIHIAGCLAEKYGGENTGLVDLDPNESSLLWSAAGKLPFAVVTDDSQLGDEEFVVYDSQGRLRNEQLKYVAEASDLMILVTTPRQGSAEAMLRLVDDVVAAGAEGNYRVLINNVPWWNPRKARNLRREFIDEGIPIFETMIPQREAVEDAWENGHLVKDVRRRNARDVWDAFGKVIDEIEQLMEDDGSAEIVGG